MRNFTILLLALYLSGCATLQESPPKVVTVKVPVPVPCIEQLPAAPTVHTDAALLTMDDYGFVSAVHADRLALDAYRMKLEALLEGCR